MANLSNNSVGHVSTYDNFNAIIVNGLRRDLDEYVIKNKDLTNKLHGQRVYNELLERKIKSGKAYETQIRILNEKLDRKTMEVCQLRIECAGLRKELLKQNKCKV